MTRTVWRLIAVASLLALTVIACGCAQPAPEAAPSTDAETPDTQTPTDDLVTDELEGLAFVRDGGVWVVENGSERMVSEAMNPRGLAYTRTGESLTFIADTTDGATVFTAARGDWRAEPLWQSPYSSMLEIAYHDDIEDRVWFSVVGDASTSLKWVDLDDGVEQSIELDFEPSGWFSVRYEDNTLFATDALQYPTRLFAVTEGGDASLVAESDALWIPRLNSDATTIVTSALRDGGDRPVILLIDVESGAASTIESSDSIWPSPPVLSPDGTHIATRDTQSGHLIIVDGSGNTSRDTGILVEDALAW